MALIFATSGVYAQSDSSEVWSDRVAVHAGSALMPGAAFRSNALFASIPKVGFTYERRFSKRFGLAFMSDMELATYTVNEREDNEFERTNAWSSCLTVNVHFGPAFSIFAGGGYELEKNFDQALGRFGLQYAFEPIEGWDVSPLVWYELKEVHNALILAISIGRTF